MLTFKKLMRVSLRILRHPSLLPRYIEVMGIRSFNWMTLHAFTPLFNMYKHAITYITPSHWYKTFSAKKIDLVDPLDPVETPDNSETAVLENTIDEKTLPFYTIPEGCEQLKQTLRFFTKDKTTKLRPPSVLNAEYIVSSQCACTVKLLDTYLAEIPNAQIFAGTGLIVTQGMILYDEIDKATIDLYGIKSLVISSVSLDTITIHIPVKTESIQTGIHLTQDHSMNYFHWIVECLPKLSLISDLDINIPLLVDDFLPEQCYEALNLLNSDQREIIRIKKETTYTVEKLYYPSRLSVIHDNYDCPIYDKDVIYSAEAINFVRSAILAKINHSDAKHKRKIYLSRKKAHYRKLLNSVEIEDLLTSRGFEIVFPENLSFLSQVQIFSQAEIIIGQSGAGMANLIFAPKTATILVMVTDAPEANFQIFNTLAQTVGIHTEFLVGKRIPLSGKYRVHSDFHVDTTLLTDYLDKRGLEHVCNN